MTFSYILFARFIFMIFDSILAQSLIVKNGVELSYTADTRSWSFTDDQRFEIFSVGEIEDCLIECGLRNYCDHLTYSVNMRVCELYKVGTGEKIRSNASIWIHVRGENIIIKKSPCEECPNMTVCDWRSVSPKCILKECPDFPSIENGRVIGNLRRIGSRIRIKCNHGWKPDKSISSVCLENGTWNATVTCLKWTPLNKECLNSDESCSDINAECSEDGTSNRCLCRDTHFQNGKVCLRKAALNEACKISTDDSCLDDNAECSVDAASSSGFICKCRDLYFQKGQNCEAKAELGDNCTFASESCKDDNAWCAEDATGFTCKCRYTYYKHQSICVERTNYYHKISMINEIRVGQSCKHAGFDEACLDSNARCEGNDNEKKCYCKFQYEYNITSKKCEKFCDEYSNNDTKFVNPQYQAAMNNIFIQKGNGTTTFKQCVEFCNKTDYLSINYYESEKHCVCNKLSFCQYNKTFEQMHKAESTFYDRPCIKPTIKMLFLWEC